MTKSLLPFFLLISALAFGQNTISSLEWYSQLRNERLLSDSASLIHSELKGYTFWDLFKYAPDYKAIKQLVSAENKFLKWSFSPLIDASAAISLGNKNQSIAGGIIGGTSHLQIANRFYLDVNGALGLQQPAAYMSTIFDSLNVVPGFGMANKTGDNYQFDQLGFNAIWRASKHFNVIAGRGRQFIGEGYRSAFLSDYTSNYNYLKLDVAVWRIRYQVMYNQMSHPQAYPINNRPLRIKYSTMHYLSLNVTKRWTIGAFESIVWEGRNDSVKRGFDINYLNPVIFYRPVEYGIGSADNALLGFSSTIRPFKGFTMFMNIVLDEFLFGEVIAPIRNALTGSVDPTGSNRNKQGYQFGLKYHEPFKLKNASVLAEVNFVRPYTFAHGSETQSYTHMSQSLANPLGANFIEWIAMAAWQPSRWNFGLQLFYHRKGYTNSELSFGEDPMRPLPDIDGTSRTFGNFITQGRRQDVANIITDVQYILVPAWDLRLVSSVHYRFTRESNLNTSLAMVSVGVKTSLWNTERGL